MGASRGIKPRGTGDLVRAWRGAFPRFRVRRYRQFCDQAETAGGQDVRFQNL